MGSNSSNMTNQRDTVSWALVCTGALLASVAIMLGAFGAHALEQRFSLQALGWWHTATDYQIWHALGALAIAFSGLRWAWLPAWLLVAGALVFCGTLDLMALGAPHWLGAITPIGGLLMISGWLMLAWRAWSHRQDS